MWVPKNQEPSCLSVYPARAGQCLSHSRRPVRSENKSALMKEWNWLKHSQSKLVLGWICTYQCVNLFQDFHKLLDSGFYSPIKFAEGFSLQILGQETLCRNNALLQGFPEAENSRPRHWWSSHPHSPNSLGQTSDLQLHLLEKTEPPYAPQ